MDALTRGDARRRVDDWRVDLRSGSYSRVVVSVPWVGYPFVRGVGRGEATLLLVVPVLVMALATATDLGRRRSRRSTVAG